jgi:hypothetical protein
MLGLTPMLHAADLYWDPDGSAAGNTLLNGSGTGGAGLGGVGTWDAAASSWWNGASNSAWTNSTADRAIFAGPTSAPATVTVSPGLSANQVVFGRSGYTLTGGNITRYKQPDFRHFRLKRQWRWCG